MAKMSVEDSSLTAVADAIRSSSKVEDPLVFPNGFVDSIGDLRKRDYTYSIIDRSVTEITADMLQGITVIGNSAFYALSSVVSIELPEGVEKCGQYFCSSCSRLKYITLPSTLKSISSSSFTAVTLLEVVTKAKTPPALSNGFSISGSGKIVVPKGCLEAYKSATNWSSKADYMVESEDF